MRVRVGLLRINTVHSGVHTAEDRIARFLVSASVNSRQYVVMYRSRCTLWH